MAIIGLHLVIQLACHPGWRPQWPEETAPVDDAVVWLHIGSHRTVYFPGENVLLEVTITSRDHRALACLGRFDPGENMQFDIRSEPHGRLRFHSAGVWDRPFASLGRACVLPPGGEYTEVMDLGVFYGMRDSALAPLPLPSMPDEGMFPIGRYQVVATYRPYSRTADIKRLVSAPFRFEVIEPTGAPEDAAWAGLSREHSRSDRRYFEAVSDVVTGHLDNPHLRGLYLQSWAWQRRWRSRFAVPVICDHPDTELGGYLATYVCGQRDSLSIAQLDQCLEAAPTSIAARATRSWRLLRDCLSAGVGTAPPFDGS
jgi:hypothetical protein